MAAVVVAGKESSHWQDSKACSTEQAFPFERTEMSSDKKKSHSERSAATKSSIEHRSEPAHSRGTPAGELVAKRPIEIQARTAKSPPIHQSFCNNRDVIQSEEAPPLSPSRTAQPGAQSRDLPYTV
jgi:hypothetical protein